MAVFKRRNAALGWAALLIGKRVLRRKAKAAAVRVAPEGRHRLRKPVALLAAVVVGFAAFLRRQARGDGPKF